MGMQMIGDAAGCRDRPETLRARELVRGLERIPSLPRLHLELLMCLGQDEPRPDEAARIAREDLGLAALLLRLANASRPAGGLGQAAGLVSLEALRSKVRQHGAVASAWQVRAAGIDLDRLWRHSREVAASARLLVQAQGGTAAASEEAFIAGLLHDLGRAILAGEPEFGYPEIIAAAREPGASLVALEQARYGTDHAQVGAELLRSWGLDARISEPVRRPHRAQPGQAPGSITLAVQYADAWSSRRIEYDPFADGAPGPVPAAVRAF